jgi:hypothetical protein
MAVEKLLLGQRWRLSITLRVVAEVQLTRRRVQWLCFSDSMCYMGGRHREWRGSWCWCWLACVDRASSVCYSTVT